MFFGGFEPLVGARQANSGYDGSGNSNMKTAIRTIAWDKKIQIALLTVATFIALC